MKALILNSGLGRRMGVLTSEHPKCMTEVSAQETILSRQLHQIAEAGIEEVVMTTGLFDQVLEQYCKSLDLPLAYTFVKNPVYDKTNYIYSIYCAREKLKDDDLLLMHGDLVFENRVLDQVLASEDSCMTVSSTVPLPEKDFKAVIHDNRIEKVGIEFFEDAMAAQPLYKLKKKDWKIWLDRPPNNVPRLDSEPQVRIPISQGWYPNGLSAKAKALVSKSPIYPVHATSKPNIRLQ